MFHVEFKIRACGRALLLCFLLGAPVKREAVAQIVDAEAPLFYSQISKDSSDEAVLNSQDELSTRIIAGKGDTVTVAYNSCVISGTIQIKEVERRSRIQQDLLLLAKRLAGERADQPCGPEIKKYRTRYERSLITLTATDDKGKVLGTKTVIVGPTERLSLGLDLPVNGRDVLKYDETTKALMPKEKAPAFYLSLNLSLGDVLTPPDEMSSFAEHIDVKFMVKAASRPLESYGIGIGYKLAGFKNLDLNGFSVFAGYFMTKQDQIVNGAPREGGDKKYSWRAGISYDFGTALKWVKY